MKLLTRELIGKIPALYATEHQSTAQKVIYVKFFHPFSNWTWYVLEFDGEDECFGLVVGHDIELGYFRISELEVVIVYGVGVERDRYFKPTRLVDLEVPGIERFR